MHHINSEVLLRLNGHHERRKIRTMKQYPESIRQKKSPVAFLQLGINLISISEDD